MAGAASRPPKLVLAVVDGLKPAMLERAVQTGRAPALQAVMDRGTYVDACCAAFPSVTPVCAATIATGTRQDRHRIPSMNWYSREEERYVEYGSSFSAARRFGVVQQLTDTIYNMNLEHLPADVPTVFETLDDRDVRTAGTTYLFYRGRHRHEVSRETALTRLASTVVRRPVMGPRELFYADLFASRHTGCRSQFGLPGIRDQHAGCVGAYLVDHDLFDFLLLSLPDNDTHSHANGPHAQVTSIATADRQLERMMHAGGGTDAFLDEHAVVVVADHSHAPVEQRIELGEAFEDWHLLSPSGSDRKDAEIALCPAQRSAMVYALLAEGRSATVPRIVDTALAIDGVDLVMWRPAPREGAIARRSPDGGRYELRFAPGGDVRDERGARWSLQGPQEVLRSRIDDGVLRTPDYPDALARVWAALTCETSGDVLISAAPGYEFPDWGGVDHVGGGSHGSLHRVDSLGALAFCGVEAPVERAGGAWSIADVAPMVVGHFAGG
ncbi:MAG TPA: alkaline phosphatase family protein [Solirubrobacteraceae bacterium]|jgi:Type I phosphodiesterase / nucleotide pyrophosphatase|nr:alkaline phosphatase family protein [Solirubrobacteraceae bacterium]